MLTGQQVLQDVAVAVVEDALIALVVDAINQRTVVDAHSHLADAHSVKYLLGKSATVIQSFY